MNNSGSSENKKQLKVDNSGDDESRSGVAVSSKQIDTAEVADTDEEDYEAESSSSGKRKWLVIVGAVLLLGGGFWGWRWWQDSTAQSQQSLPGQSQSRAIPVNISTVETSTVEENSEFVGNLESRQSVTLLPQVQGRVSQIYASPGERVSAGTPIIQINPDEQQAVVSGAQAAAAAARSQVANARASLDAIQAERLSRVSQLQLSQKQYERYASLAAEGAVARDTRDQYFNELQTARSSLAAIEEQINARRAALAEAQQALEQAQASIQQERVQLQYYEIDAPFSGTVGAIPVKIGDYVTPSTALTTVTQNQPLEVNINIPRERAYQVEEGSLVELLNAQGEKIGDSRVFFISPQVSNETQSVLIKALFPNSPTQLRADSSVRARVIWERRPGVLIPATAVSRIGGQAFVYVVEEAGSEQSQLIARQTPVELGSIQGNSYQVLEGLEPGDAIVTSGLIKLSNGAPITPAS